MTDDDLLHALRAMWTDLDPAPDGLTDDVLLRLAPELDDDAELLALLTGDDLPTAIRAPAAGTLTFAGGGIDLLIRVGGLADDRRRIDGWIAPAARGAVRLTVGSVVVDAPLPPTGRFALPDVPAGEAVLDVSIRTDGELRRLRTPAFPL
jgi:hypothetical protein